MGAQEKSSVWAYVLLLTEEARRLQREARDALDQGHYARATALLGDAELLAEDTHYLVGDIERREFGGLMELDAYDVREVALPVPARAQWGLTLPSRSLRMAISTSLAMSLALTEW